jgi:hypothetical protein
VIPEVTCEPPYLRGSDRLAVGPGAVPYRGNLRAATRAVGAADQRLVVADGRSPGRTGDVLASAAFATGWAAFGASGDCSALMAAAAVGEVPGDGSALEPAAERGEPVGHVPP